MSSQCVQTLCHCILPQVGLPEQYPASYSSKKKDSRCFPSVFVLLIVLSSFVTPESFINTFLPFLFLLWLLLLKFLPSFGWTATEKLDRLASNYLLSQSNPHPGHPLLPSYQAKLLHLCLKFINLSNPESPNVQKSAS